VLFAPCYFLYRLCRDQDLCEQVFLLDISSDRIHHAHCSTGRTQNMLSSQQYRILPGKKSVNVRIDAQIQVKNNTLTTIIFKNFMAG